MKKIISPEQKYLNTLLSAASIFLIGYLILIFTKIIVEDYLYLNGKIINNLLRIFDLQFIMVFFTALYVIFTFLMFVQLKKQNDNLREQIKKGNKTQYCCKISSLGS